jgi:uncharacterized membrane protein YjjP (DUF1212 family)
VLKKLLKDNRGVGVVLGIAVLSFILLPLVYFPLSYAWDTFFIKVTGSYVFTGITANAIVFVNVLISWLIIFGLLFTINWAIVQAKSRRYQA